MVFEVCCVCCLCRLGETVSLQELGRGLRMEFWFGLKNRPFSLEKISSEIGGEVIEAGTA